MLLGSYRDSKGRAKLDDLWRKVIRLRSLTCEMCDSARATDCAHYVRRGILATRWHPDNGNMLCYSCHRRYDRLEVPKIQWKSKWDSIEAAWSLDLLARSTEPVDTDAVHAELVRRLETT